MKSLYSLLIASQLFSATFTNFDYIEPIIKSSLTQTIQQERSYKIIKVKGGSFKSFEDYRKITDKTTSQWRLLQKAKSNSIGLMKFHGRYCIAMGSRFSRKIGTKIDILLSSGKTLKCVLADQKADTDTDRTNSHHKIDGSVVEFLVDDKKLKKKCKTTGDISFSGKKFNGDVVKVYVLKE